MDKDSMLFVGLDLGDRWSHLAILDQEGEMMEEGRIPTTPAAMQRKFSSLVHCRVAMEVGAHSRWASQTLQELGHEVLVANARKLRVIFDNPRKGDRADAHTLARLARLDPKLLSPIEHRSPQAQADLTVLHSRDALVRTRTLLVNHVRGVVKSTGARISLCSANSFPSKAAASLPETLKPALLPILETVHSLNQQIQSYDRQIEDLCAAKYPDCQRLRSIHGVGPITALAFVLTLENPKRFQKSREVGPALGLVPRRDQSGRQDPQLHITKTGNTGVHPESWTVGSLLSCGAKAMVAESRCISRVVGSRSTNAADRGCNSSSSCRRRPQAGSAFGHPGTATGSRS